ncbi:uncharacterized protein RJT20DRAFT_127352, partial [Scheffersomyces xylosifermentans]|uniref:uncharacterized protein n=1 Tax=Scheffersomyces xylosifermentans TaxID=1304137 RepID=UPI00315D1C88
MERRMKKSSNLQVSTTLKDIVKSHSLFVVFSTSLSYFAIFYASLASIPRCLLHFVVFLSSTIPLSSIPPSLSYFLLFYTSFSSNVWLPGHYNEKQTNIHIIIIIEPKRTPSYDANNTS